MQIHLSYCTASAYRVKKIMSKTGGKVTMERLRNKLEKRTGTPSVCQSSKLAVLYPDKM